MPSQSISGRPIGTAHRGAPESVEAHRAETDDLSPLVLHGASSICRADVKAAIRSGVRKINVGSVLKKSLREALRLAF